MENKKAIVIVGVVIVVILIIVGVVYFLGDRTNLDLEVPVEQDCLDLPNGGNQVYNVSENKYTYNDAMAVCKAHGSRLATLKEVIEAYKNGASWCNYGWSEGQLALYPTQKNVWKELQKDPERKTECGLPGVNGGYFQNDEYMFGANCYGRKPTPKKGERMRNLIEVTDPMDAKVNSYKAVIDDINIAPFSKDKWSEFGNNL